MPATMVREAGVVPWLQVLQVIGYHGVVMSEPAVAEIRVSAAERSKVHAVRDLVGKGTGRVCVQVGDDQIVLPRSLVKALMVAAGSLEGGDTVAIVSEEAEVSPAQAAKLLGVSRQYVDRLIADELLPSRRLPHSSYRKIPVKAVLAHRKVRDVKREGVRTIVDGAIEAGLEY